MSTVMWYVIDRLLAQVADIWVMSCSSVLLMRVICELWASSAVHWDRHLHVCRCATLSRVPLLRDVIADRLDVIWWHFSRGRHTRDVRQAACSHADRQVLVNAVSSLPRLLSPRLPVHRLRPVVAGSYLLLWTMRRRLVSAGSVSAHAQLSTSVRREPRDRKEFVWRPLCVDWWRDLPGRRRESRDVWNVMPIQRRRPPGMYAFHLTRRNHHIAT